MAIFFFDNEFNLFFFFLFQKGQSMELTISQRKFSADGATKGKEMMVQLSDCINRRDFFYPVQFSSFLIPTRKAREIRLAKFHSGKVALPRF